MITAVGTDETRILVPTIINENDNRLITAAQVGQGHDQGPDDPAPGRGHPYGMTTARYPRVVSEATLAVHLSNHSSKEEEVLV